MGGIDATAGRALKGCTYQDQERWVISLLPNHSKSTNLIPRVAGILFLLASVLLASRGILAQNQPPSLQDYFQRAAKLESQQDYARAAEVYQEAAKSFPNQPEVLKRLGIVYQTELRFQESIGVFQHILRQVPQYPEVNFYEGLSYFGLNRFQDAVAAFNRELEANPQYRPARYYAALAFESLGRNADALAQFEALLKMDPNDQQALYQLIRFYKAATLQAINQLGNLNPDSNYMHMLKGQSYEEEGKYAEAIANFRAVIKKTPSFPGVHFALGETYWKKVDYKNAEPQLHLALKEDPNQTMANYYLGDILMKSQRIAEAIPHFQTTVAGDPKFIMGYIQLGKCYEAESKFQDALKYWLEAEKLNPQDKMTHYELGQIYLRLKQPDKARPEMALFQELYAQERAKAAERERRSVESMEHSSKAETDQ